MTLFDGDHTFTRVSLYAHVFGIIVGVGLMIGLLDTPYANFGWYMVFFGIFHELEYLFTSLFNLRKLSLDSYIINQSDEYQYAIVLGIAEYCIEALFFPSVKDYLFIKLIGFWLAVLGQTFRSLAMYHAKSNFSHIISTRKEDSHQLVTSGVYSVSRHPSYFGFFWFSVGVQLLLCNPVCTCLHLFASWKFFSDRIPYEEEQLVKFFGKEYVDFQQRTSIGIPFIPTKSQGSAEGH